MVSQALLNELKVIIREDYEKDFTDKEIYELANGLVGFYDTLAKIHHRDHTSAEAPDLIRPNGSDQGL